MISKVEMHKSICAKLSQVYEAKNHDYGDSFSSLRKEFPNAILIRLGDKYSRLKSLMGKNGDNSRKVCDESIQDTLLDLANYCILEIIEIMCDSDERECDNNGNKGDNEVSEQQAGEGSSPRIKWKSSDSERSAR